MIDRRERLRTARVIAWAMRRRIDSGEFDIMLSAHSSNDKAVRSICDTLILAIEEASYDDFVRVTPAGWKVLRRCIAFLQTNYEAIGHDRGIIADSDIWPFQSRSALFAARPNLKRYKLPKYDPALHDVDPSWWNFRITWWNLPIVLGVLFGIPVLIAWWNCHR